MKGRHAASGWSPFWRDILLRALLVLLLVAMAVFIWWLFSDDDLFTETVSTTSEPVSATSAPEPSTIPGTVAPTSTVPTVTSAATDTTPAEPTTTNPPPTSTTTTIPPPLAPDELVVRVLNANGVGGVAGRTTSRIQEAGYGTESPGNHPQLLDVSRIWYREGLMREAEQLRDSLIPDALVELITQEQEGIDLLVIVGRTFQE